MKEQRNTLAIFNIYDAEGIVDRYVFYLLGQIKPYVNRLIIVCNGILHVNSEVSLREYTKEIVVRSNIGYDGGAYQEVLSEYLGWEIVQQYSRLILFNNTFFGPLYPFDEMFSVMEKRNLDFWGITHQQPSVFGKIIPLHLQSYFLVVEEKLLQSHDFIEFWEGMNGDIRDFWTAVTRFELRFTATFAERGYLWDSYVHLHGYTDLATDYHVNCLYEAIYVLISRARCPILKRKIQAGRSLDFSMGEDLHRAIEFVTEKLDYDVSMIWENLFRTQDCMILQSALALNFILPIEGHRHAGIDTKYLAVFVQVHSIQGFEFAQRKLASIGVVSEHIYYAWFGDHQPQLSARSSELLDFSISAIMAGKKLYERSLCQYPYIVIVDDSVADWQNLLPSLAYAAEVKKLFEQHDYLGIFLPNDERRKKYKNQVLLNTFHGQLPAMWCRREILRSIWYAEDMKKIVQILHVLRMGYGFIQTQAFALQHIERMQRVLDKNLPWSSLLTAATSDVQDNKLFDWLFKHSQSARWQQREKNCRVYCAGKRYVYLYGAGKWGCLALQMLNRLSVPCHGFIVSDQASAEAIIDGIAVYHLAEIDLEPDDGVIIAIKGGIVQTEVKEYLALHGYLSAVCLDDL